MNIRVLESNIFGLPDLLFFGLTICINGLDPLYGCTYIFPRYNTFLLNHKLLLQLNLRT